MATYPNISAGEGLIRTYDLLSSLINDAFEDFKFLHKNKSSQHLRRNVVRSTFSFIEGLIQVIKFEVYADIRLERSKFKLSEKEIEFLKEKKIVNDESIKWNIPLELNLKKTISLANKIWGIKNNKIDFGKIEYKSFLYAKHTRNRLTHPKTYYDIEISDEEMADLALTFTWLRMGFQNMVKEKIDLIETTLPTNFVNKFRIEILKEYCC
jgi:hypothetical protein